MRHKLSRTELWKVSCPFRKGEVRTSLFQRIGIQDSQLAKWTVFRALFLRQVLWVCIFQKQAIDSQEGDSLRILREECLCFWAQSDFLKALKSKNG